MSEKEIQELLKTLKFNIPCEYIRSCDTGDGIGRYEEDEYSWQYKLYIYINQLQEENQELKEKIKTYENPEDLTLMFMYCNEKVKDKIKELEEENFNLRENIYIEKMSFPSEGRNIKELIEMPSYEGLQQENEKLHHYKTLYQSLKKQKEELKDWLKTDSDKIKVFDTKDNKAVELGIVLGLGMCLEKLEELEGVSNE